jgi:hypothetical protein
MDHSLYAFASEARRKLASKTSGTGKMPFALVYDLEERQKQVSSYDPEELRRRYGSTCKNTETFFPMSSYTGASDRVLKNKKYIAYFTWGGVCFGSLYRNQAEHNKPLALIAGPNLHMRGNKGAATDDLFRYVLFDSPFSRAIEKPSLPAARRLGFIMDTKKGRAQQLCGGMQVIRQLTEFASFSRTFAYWRSKQKEYDLTPNLAFMLSVMTHKGPLTRDQPQVLAMAGAHSFFNLTGNGTWHWAEVENFVKDKTAASLTPWTSSQRVGFRRWITAGIGRCGLYWIPSLKRRSL